MPAAPIPLRVHGHHSLLVGVDSPAELLERGAALGLEALALWYVDSVAGVVGLLQAATRLEEAGTRVPRPIVGAELSDPSGRPGRLIALVRDEQGWRSLCALVSARRLGADPGSNQPEALHGPASFELVEAASLHAAGLIFLVGDHPRLLLALAGRLEPDQLFAALPLPPAGFAKLAGPRHADAARVWSLFDPPEPPDPDQLGFLDAGKTPSPARPGPGLVLGLIETARAHGVPLVAAPDCYHALPGGRRAQRVRAAIRANALLEHVPETWLALEPAHLLGADQLRTAYAEYGECLVPRSGTEAEAEAAVQLELLFERSHAIAARCRYTPPLGGVVFPELDFGPEASAYSELARLAFAGASKRYRPLSRAVVERLEMELAAIDGLGFAAYFLFVDKIAGFARKQSIPYVGRGSAADSLVAYCLELTDADPLRYRLPFERFLNPTRKDRPDIDLDFCWRRRDEVLAEVYNAFGPTRTAMISTLGTFGLRSAFREAALAVGLAPPEFERWSKRLPWSPPGRGDFLAPPAGLDRLADNPVAQAFAAMPECRHFPFDDARFVRTIEAAADLLDVPRHMGLHPGGVVVAPRSITDHVACARAAKGPVVTQFDKHGVEALGLVKMDLLGNRALTVVDDCLGILRDECGVELDLEAIPEDDPETAALLATGRTIGCFQIESPGMRNLLKQTAAATMDDVIQAVALIRPGPAGSGMKDAYIRRFRGLEEPTPPHPLLIEVLAETHGVMLYQEDVMQVAVALAGMSLAEADQLRRALSKRRGAELERLGARFLEGSAQKGVAEADAKKVWELISNFAAFGFCKAHAVTYGRIAYRTVYLKAHFPVAFLAAFLASYTGYYAARVYVEEARRLGAAILGPDINKSTADYRFTRTGAPLGARARPGWPAIRAGLGQVRGLAESTIERLLESRTAEGPYLSLPDLLERVAGPGCPAGLRHADSGELEALIRAGALDSFDRTRPELLWRLQLLRKPARKPPRLAGEQALDRLALESLCSTPEGRLAERAESQFRAGNNGWGSDGGRLPLVVAEAPPDGGGQPLLAFPQRELGAPALPALPDPEPKQRALEELELLGFTTSLHPVELFGDRLPPVPEPLTACAELDRWAGQRITVVGWVAASRRLRSNDGRWMRFLTLEDQSGLAEAAIFADAYARWAPVLSGPGPYLVSGKVEDQMGSCSLHVEKILAPLDR